MDSLSQIALGAAVGVAVMGRRTAVWKSALWGAAAGTLPDLDVLLDYGDPIRNMVLHRGASHAPFWLTLLSLPLSAAVAWIHGERALWRRWWLAIWLSLVTHPLLDSMTVYGTQLALPFSNHPFGVGSIFIIDPLYTLPLLCGTAWALLARKRDGHAGMRANLAGLLLSTAYLGWTFAAQQHVEKIAQGALESQGVRADRLLVTPAPFNTILWRVLVISGDSYLEGFYSLLDEDRKLAFDRFGRLPESDAQQALPAVKTIAAFSKGFYALNDQNGPVRVTDLRMGQEPHYTFSFDVAEQGTPPVPLAKPEQVGSRPDLSRAASWLGRRIWGEPLPPPR